MNMTGSPVKAELVTHTLDTSLGVNSLYTVNRKKRGSTFVIITLEKHIRLL